eukprot:1104539-Alexandrium_andersonii.AAC.1
MDGVHLTLFPQVCSHSSVLAAGPQPPPPSGGGSLRQGRGCDGLGALCRPLRRDAEGHLGLQHREE